MVGTVGSRFTVAEAAALTLSATSVQVPARVWPAPSVLTNPFAEQPAIPDPLSASVPLKLTVTSVRCQFAAFAAGETDAAAMGGVKSMLMPETAADALLPARSEQMPVADCPAPFAFRTLGRLHPSAATPDRASNAEYATVTSDLFQPAALAAGARIADATGGVRSMLMGE